MLSRYKIIQTIVIVLLLAVVLPVVTSAHNVSKRDATFVQANRGPP